MLAVVLTALVALIHLWIVVLEMLLWTRPLGRKTFGLTEEFAAQSRVLAANQGLYNGFLLAGLVWALAWGLQGAGHAPGLFFLTCVLVAGVFGGATVSRRVLYVQALPAALAILALTFNL